MKQSTHTDRDSPLPERSTPTRRTVLYGAGATIFAGALAGCTGGDDDEATGENGPNGERDGDDTGETGGDGDGPYQYQLEGATSAWVGISPTGLADEGNPTLPIVPGEDYEVLWINTDGAGHNFAIADDGGGVLEASDIIGTNGETQSVEFTATEEMSEYLCQPHPDTMVGTFEIVDDMADVEDELGEPVDPEDAIEEDAAPEDVDDEPPLEEDPDMVFELDLEDGQWTGISPSEIEGETNPTLTVEADTLVEVAWTAALEIEADEDQVGTGEGDVEEVEDEETAEDEDGPEPDDEDAPDTVDEDEDDTPDEHGTDVDEDDVIAGEPREPGHNLIVADEMDRVFLRSPEVFEQGETQRVQFIPEAGLTTYYDEVQEDSARGDITVS
jgi:hypothetical protein